MALKSYVIPHQKLYGFHGKKTGFGCQTSQSVENSVKYEIFMEGFRIDLKTFLGLAMPN